MHAVGDLLGTDNFYLCIVASFILGARSANAVALEFSNDSVTPLLEAQAVWNPAIHDGVATKRLHVLT